MNLMLLKNARAGINLFSNDEINVRQCREKGTKVEPAAEVEEILQARTKQLHHHHIVVT